MVHHKFEASLVVVKNSMRHLDQLLMYLKISFLSKLNESFSLGVDSVFRYEERFLMPNVYDLRNSILEEAHGSHNSTHRGSTKMYHYLRVVFFSHPRSTPRRYQRRRFSLRNKTSLLDYIINYHRINYSNIEA